MPSSILVVIRDNAYLINGAGWMLPVTVVEGWESESDTLLIRVPIGAEYIFDVTTDYLNEAPWFVAAGELRDAQP